MQEVYLATLGQGYVVAIWIATDLHYEILESLFLPVTFLMLPLLKRVQRLADTFITHGPPSSLRSRCAWRALCRW